MARQHLIDRNGNQISLGSELGKGGEGVVYHVQGKPNAVAKIYLKPPDTEKSYKIINMVNVGTERLLKLAAWPLDTIHVHSGDLVGFLMPKLQGYRPLFELYSPKLRLQEFPQADWRFLIHAAANTARAFSVIHEAGHVIGDVNHGNLLVASDATVKFIDTDSFQISIKAQHWLCEVGVATHQPPEMQGLLNYRGLFRTSNQDNFGLAVLIFQLLCLARHPFSGRFSGLGDMPIEKAITECRFAYARDNRSTQMTPPPASLPMNALTPRIFSNFEKAFSKEGITQRPTAKEWISAIEELATSLKQCQSNQAHFYLNSISNCPWCDIETKSCTTIFPVIVNLSNPNQSFKVLWQQVLTIKDPGQALPLPKVASISLSPSREAQEAGLIIQRLERQSILLWATLGIGIIVLGSLYGCNVAQLILGGLAFWRYIYQSKEKDKLTSNLHEKVTAFKTRWDELSSKWGTLVSNAAFVKAKQPLDALKKQYDDLYQERQYRLQKLWDDRRTQQLHAHLDRYRISAADIEGIAQGRVTTLQSYGIETAADIDPWQIEGISGFGPKLIHRLTDWRYRCEQTFIFDSSKGVPQTEIQVLERDLMTRRRKLEQELATGIVHLTRTSDQILESRSQIYSQASSLLKAYAQAIADAREVGINP